MKRKVSLLLITILFASIFILGCTSSSEDIKNTQEFFAMDTIIDITIYGENYENAFKECSKELNRLDKLFSVTDENSDIYKINNSNSERVEVNKDTLSVVTSAIELSNITNGDFDITIYPLVELYGFTTDEYYAPTQEEIDEKLNLVNYKNIIIDDTSIAIDKGMAIDLGGIAKGYASGSLKEILIDNGVEKAIISLGGNVETVGIKSDNEKWQVGVQNPEAEDIIMTLAVGETTVITSGAYRRNVTIDGEFYHHIIDPKTGKPADSGVKSVTIVGDDGVHGDALSTALYVKGEKEGIEFLKENKDIKAIVIADDNKIYISKDLKESVNLEEEYKDIYQIEYV